MLQTQKKRINKLQIFQNFYNKKNKITVMSIIQTKNSFLITNISPKTNNRQKK